MIVFLVISLLFSLHEIISSANSELMYLESVGFYPLILSKLEKEHYSPNRTGGCGYPHAEK